MERGKRRRMRRSFVRGVRGGFVGVRVIKMAVWGLVGVVMSGRYD
jgi:hypothetical protein